MKNSKDVSSDDSKFLSLKNKIIHRLYSLESEFNHNDLNRDQSSLKKAVS